MRNKPTNSLVYRCVGELVLLTLLTIKNMSNEDIDNIVQLCQTELQDRAVRDAETNEKT